MVIDWTHVQKRYSGLWVAFLEDEQTVVGSGPTARTALEVAQKHGFQEPILTYMPKRIVIRA